MLDRNARELLASGGVIYLGTRDAAMSPDLTHAMGVTVHDPRSLTLYLPVNGPTEACLRNLRDNGQVAATFCRPSDDRSLQIKGTVRSVRDAGPEDRVAIEVFRSAYAEQLAVVGVPRNISRRVRCLPAVAVQIDVHAVFDQTPGPLAGQVWVHGA